MSMKCKLIKWVILWFLSISVTSSTLFSCCTKTKQIEFFSPRISDQIKLSKSNETVLVERKKIIQNDNTDLYLTNDQKKYVYALCAVVKIGCRGCVSTKYIVYLILDYLRAPFPKNQILPACFVVGFHAVSCTNDYSSTINLWNVASGQFIREMTDTGNTVCCFTSDGHYIISACRKTKNLKLWTVPACTLVRTFKGHTGDITSCSLSTHDQILLSTSMDGTVRLWAVRTGKCTQELTGHYWPVNWGQFCNRDRLVVSAAQLIRIWDVNTGECVRVLKPQRDERISRCVFSDNERLLISLGNDGVSVWQLATGTHVQTFHGHAIIVPNEVIYRYQRLTTEKVVPYQVKYACFVRQDTHVASVGDDFVLYIWRVHDAKCIRKFADYERMIDHSYWLKSDAIECIIVSNGYELHVLAVESGETIFTLTGHTHRIYDFFVSSDGRFLTSRSADNGRVFIFAEHKKLQTF